MSEPVHVEGPVENDLELGALGQRQLLAKSRGGHKCGGRTRSGAHGRILSIVRGHAAGRSYKSPRGRCFRFCGEGLVELFLRVLKQERLQAETKDSLGDI